MSLGGSSESVHKDLVQLKQQGGGRYLAFADVDPREDSPHACAHLCPGILHYQLDGLKIHPANTAIPADCPDNHYLLELAETLRIPVAVHCYPNDDHAPCAAWRVRALALAHPGLRLIVSHMGGFQWQQLLGLENIWLDLSAILPDYVTVYGLKKTNRILRSFGTDRILFATDYPCSRSLSPEEIYPRYMEILDQMDFSLAERRQIAWSNAAHLFGLEAAAGENNG